MKTKYEPIKFDSWQELAKYVIDGGEVYYEGEKIVFDNDYSQFNYQFTEHLMSNTFTKKQLKLEELIAIKPRLCWVFYKNKKFLKVIVNIDEHGFFVDSSGCTYDNAQMLTDDEIKQFLGGE